MGNQKTPERKSSAKSGASKANQKQLSFFNKAKNALIGSMKPPKGKAAPAPKKAMPAPNGKKAPVAAAASSPAKKGNSKLPPAVATKASAPAPLPEKNAKGAKGSKAAANQLRREAAAAKAQTHHDESVCREVACEGLSTTAGYCRMHYIKNWKKIKRKELILKEGKLNQYIEELVAKYPDKYIEAIRQDLASDKDFAKVIYDLDLDESIDDFDVEGEGVEGIIDSIKRDFDDEGDSGF